MSSIGEFYKQSELAFAAYADLRLLLSESLLESGFSASQTSRFISEWEVVEQYTSSTGDDAGLSATVFRERATGRTHLAVRGTELGDIYDVLADLVDIAGLGSTLFMGQYEGLRVRVQTWLANGVLRAGFSASGHSLGGFLAAALANDFAPFLGSIYTFNAPGFGGVGAQALRQSPVGLGILQLAVGTMPRPSIFNLRADHTIASLSFLGVRSWPSIEIHIENQLTTDAPQPPPSVNHSVQALSDALSLYDAISRIDPALSLGDAGRIVDASHRLTGHELEQVANQLIRILKPSDTSPVAIHDRNQLFVATRNLAGLALPDHMIRSLVGLSAREIAVNSAQDLAWQYALETLQPFALFGPDYSMLSAGLGPTSSHYLGDRANLLVNLLRMNSQDVGVQVGDTVYLASGAAAYFDDRRTSLKFVLGLGPNANVSLIRNYAFGGDATDLLAGGHLADRLYGAHGADVLAGGKGNDRLEGGEDHDTYVVAQGDGADTIFDSDGQGELRLGSQDGFQIAGVVDSTGQYLSPLVRVSGGNTYELGGLAYSYRGDLTTGATLTVSGSALGGSGNSITIEQFTNGALGVYLPSAPGIWLRPRYVTEIPAESGGGLAATIAEGTAATFTVSTDVTSDTDTVVRVAVDGSGNGLSAVLGASEASFAPGFVDMVIPAGQNRATFSVRATGDFDSSTSLNLSAALLGGSTSASVLLTVDGGSETDEPTTTNTILGDQLPPPPGTTDPWGNTIGGAPAPGRNDFLNGSPDNDRIEGLGGDDTINGHDGDDWILGGDGNDWIAGLAGNDRVEGGTGDDFAIGGFGNDLMIGGDGNDNLLGTEGDDRVYADAQDDDNTIFDSDTVTATPGRHWLDGGEGRDRLIGGTTGDVLLGGAGDDMLAGGAGADTLYGDRDTNLDPFPFTPGTPLTLTVGAINAAGGKDFLHGGGGDDFLYGEAGDDTLLGGGGDDELVGDSSELAEALHGGDFLDGGDGDDRLFGQGGNDVLFGGAGNDYLLADSPAHAPGDDYLSGEDGDDELIGMGGRDVLYGGAGNDQLFGDSDDTPLAQQQADELFGGDGDDLLQGYGGDDYLDGGTGNDTALGGLGGDRILGGAGDDTLVGDAGSADPDGGDADLIEGGDGNDALFGQGGDDQLYGGDGVDQLQAGAGNDFLDGGAGNDTLLGEAGADELHGGEDDDTLAGGMGEDVLYGGDGNDLIAGDNGGTDPTGDADFIDGGAGDDQIAGQGGDDTLEGGDGDDVLAGDAGNDLLAGGAGADQLYGGVGDDRLEGGDGDDVLAGGEGNDVLAGGAGNDTYAFSQLANGVDTIVDSTAGGDTNAVSIPFAYFPGILQISLGSLRVKVGTGIDIHVEGFDPDDPFADPAINRFEFNDGTVKSYADVLAENRFDLRGTPLSDVIEGTVLEDNLSGLEGDDVLIGKAGNDQLIGGGGADVMLGNEGDDLYHVDDPDDLVLENEGEGIDTVSSTVRAMTLAENVENLSIGGIGGTAHATGNDLDNVITVSVLVDGATLRGLGGADTLVGTNGADVLDGGTGDDILAGGFGDDSYYVDSDNDVIEEFLDSGIDRVYSSSIAFDLLAEVEHLTLVEGSGAVSGVGNLLDNVITGNSGDNILAGERQLTYVGLDPAVGRDLLLGLGGNDQLDGWIGDDWLEGGEGDDELYGREGADRLFGGEGNDRLDGSTLVSFGFFGVTVLARDDDAIDVLDGGGGDDTYVIGDADDVIVEAPGGGQDTVESSIHYLLGDYLENLTLVGEVPLIGIGNDGANRLRDETSFVGFFEQTELRGLAGDDVLENGTWMDGGEGADVMIGRLGVQATYFVDNAADIVIEQPVDFVDEVYSTVTYAAPANVENLTLIGTAAIDGYGNELTNRLTGNDAPNRLEDPFGSVFASFGDQLYGMGGDDVLVAAFGDSVLDGGSGDDLMRGGLGDDTYHVDSSGDRVEELAGEGFDTVRATATFALDDHTEALYLEGADAIDGTGGSGDNFIYGNAAANRLEGGAGNDYLDGGAGADTMAGGAGDDTYVVDDLLDTVAELGGDGFDQVFSSVRFTLETGVEAITLEGDEPIDATGNDEANTIEGNDADNVLIGLGGDDDIDGGAGNDTIDGGDGDDVLYGGDDADTGGGGGEEGSGEEDPGEGELLPNHDVIRGGTGNDVIDGGSGMDELHGDDGDDILYAGDPEGTDGYLDRLYGGRGDDILYGDWNVEELFGGEGNDVLIGGGGTGDFFDGGPGIDYMEGGLGGDRYVVDGNYEIVSEMVADDCGNLVVRERLVMTEVDTIVDPGLLGDTVWARVSYALPASVTYALLQTPADPIAFADFERLGMDLTGNALNNEITGNAFANRLDGGGGNDTLRGGLGDDTYVIDSEGDVIIEAFGEGTDTVETTLQSYSLPGSSTLENLTLLDNGSTALRIAGGNGLANVMRGSSGRDNLVASFGNDTLYGGPGDDFLQGQEGNDQYRFKLGDGVDTIIDFSGVDTLRFLDAIAPGDLIWETVGADVHISIAGTTDKVILRSWMTAFDRLDRVVFCDGTLLDRAAIEALAAGNRPPMVAAPIADQSTLEDDAYLFAVPANTFTDPDPLDVLAYAATLADGSALPPWLTFDAPSVLFSGTPANADVGDYLIRVSATDPGGKSSSDDFVLTVVNVNDAPLAQDDADGAIEDGGPVRLAAAVLLANDVDIDAGDSLAIVAVSGSASGATVSLVEGDVLYDVGGLFQSLREGATAFDTFQTVVADQAGAASSATVTMAIAGVNDAPLVAVPIADHLVEAREAFSFAFAADTFLDVDEGDVLAYTATLADGSSLPGWLAFDAVTRTFSGTAPGDAECGCGAEEAWVQLEIRVTATDISGSAAFDEFALVVSSDVTGGEHVVGTKHKDVLSGTECDDFIEGLQGNDRLYGLAGNDVLAGGRGNDHLEGGLGADVYLHGLHDGHDTIRETGPDSDALVLGEGISAGMVRLRRHHDDLVVDVHGRGASVTIEDWFKSTHRRVESLVFADGTTWDESEIREHMRRADHGNDRCEPPRGDHHGDRDDHHGHSRKDAHRKSGDDEHGSRDDRDGPRDRFSHAPRFDFEALVASFDRSGHRASPSPDDIERQWATVTRYAGALSDEGDDGRRGAPAFGHVRRTMQGLVAALGWGFDGSTGASHDQDGFRSFEGIDEGFRRL